MLCELYLLLNIKEGVEKFPKVRENSPYEKLLNHIDGRELRGFGSTKHIPFKRMSHLFTFLLQIFNEKFKIFICIQD